MITNKIGKLVSLHRLVALHFIPNPNNLPEVNHKDGNKSNNNVDNLEWVTRSENIIHAMKTGLKPILKGNKHGMSKYDENTIELVCQYLEEGLLTLKEINEITSVGMNTIYHIIDKSSWVYISQKYNINNYRHYSTDYSSEDFEKVFKMLEENKLSYYDISDKSQVSVNMIRKIVRHADNPKYNHLYNIYNIANYQKKDKKYSKNITNNMIMEAQILYQNGIKKKYIKRIISFKYNINEEYIKLFLIDKL